MIAESEREVQIRRLLPLVRRIAPRIRTLVPGVEMDDLIGDGSIGLIRAVDQFDAGRGPTLEHYARRLIAGAMLNGLRRMDPVSERARRAAREGEDYRYALAIRRGSLPTLAEMDRLRPTFKRAVLASHRGTPLSIDAPLPEGEAFAQDWSADPAVVTVSNGHQEYVKRMVDALPERERRLMRGHYFAEQSLRDMGAMMGVSAQRASQLHLAAIKRLRKAMHATPY